MRFDVVNHRCSSNKATLLMIFAQGVLSQVSRTGLLPRVAIATLGTGATLLICLLPHGDLVRWAPACAICHQLAATWICAGTRRS